MSAVVMEKKNVKNTKNTKKGEKSKSAEMKEEDTKPVEMKKEETKPVKMKEEETKYDSDSTEVTNYDSDSDEETKPVEMKKEEDTKETDSDETKDTKDKKKAAVKKTRKTHKDKASDYEEGFTKTEDGVNYIVKKDAAGTMKWMIVKEKLRKKRPPTKYNLFISKTIKELRLVDNGKPNKSYMREAVAVWKSMTDEEKAVFYA